jgi:glutathione-regulated potassium-efflux system ancillary protein KefC
MQIPWRERPVFTLMLAQGGEFAFVVFQTAAQYKVFRHSVSSMLVAAVALSMLLGPLLLVLLDKLLLRRFSTIKDEECGSDKARDLRASGLAHHHCRLRPLRPDRGSRVAGPGHTPDHPGP